MTCQQQNRPAFDAPEPRRDWSLFLDIDGTLIDIAETPEAVIVPDTLSSTLAAARDWLGGALAIVSGRPFAKIDELMAPLVLPCAGEHGAILRLPDGTIRKADALSAVPEPWQQRVRAAVRNWNGLVVEYKRYSIAAHFRQVPERQDDLRKLFDSVVAEDSGDFEVLPARMAYEIRHRALNKGTAVREFMKHPPFRGRVPVFVGDDVTDEDGFSAAREMGGLALHVNEAFGKQPSNVRRWLESFRTHKAGPGQEDIE